ncbi:MAG: sucrase ferredoxin, partial [Cyanobacteria bacterium P01_A01_bin.135]
QAMVSNPRYKQHGIRFFLISDDETPRSDDSSPSQPRVLIFQQPKGFAAEYEAIELQVSTLDEAAIALQRYFAGEPLPQALTRNPLRRDLFICTHGQYHKCCGRYGYPFYQQAQQLKQQWDLPALRIWQVSHIGGHRFAPTLIDLPQGRYYGRLSADGLKLLIRQQGDWRSLLPYYRGWSLLPKSMQLLERQHWQTKGWSWLAQQIYCPSPELQPTGPAVVHTTPRRGNARMAAATSKEPASGTRL